MLTFLPTMLNLEAGIEIAELNPVEVQESQQPRCRSSSENDVHLQPILDGLEDRDIYWTR